MENMMLNCTFGLAGKRRARDVQKRAIIEGSGTPTLTPVNPHVKSFVGIRCKNCEIEHPSNTSPSARMHIYQPTAGQRADLKCKAATWQRSRNSCIFVSVPLSGRQCSSVGDSLQAGRHDFHLTMILRPSEVSKGCERYPKLQGVCCVWTISRIPGKCAQGHERSVLTCDRS